MADIELVIKIPEEVYNYIMRLDLCNMAEEYIKNGTPLPKGHWIVWDTSSYDWTYKCDKCGRIVLKESNYCPKCGCRMVAPQESEDEEGV